MRVDCLMPGEHISGFVRMQFELGEGVLYKKLVEQVNEVLEGKNLGVALRMVPASGLVNLAASGLEDLEGYGYGDTEDSGYEDLLERIYQDTGEDDMEGDPVDMGTRWHTIMMRTAA